MSCRLRSAVFALPPALCRRRRCCSVCYLLLPVHVVACAVGASLSAGSRSSVLCPGVRVCFFVLFVCFLFVLCCLLSPVLCRCRFAACSLLFVLRSPALAWPVSLRALWGVLLLLLVFFCPRRAAGAVLPALLLSAFSYVLCPARVRFGIFPPDFGRCYYLVVVAVVVRCYPRSVYVVVAASLLSPLRRCRRRSLVALRCLGFSLLVGCLCSVAGACCPSLPRLLCSPFSVGCALLLASGVLLCRVCSVPCSLSAVL